MENKKDKIILSVSTTQEKDKQFILGFCYLLANNDKWANMYFNQTRFEISNLSKKGMLKYFSKFCSLANNLWFEYNNKQVTLCVYKQSIYTTIKSLLGGIQWNEDNCNSQEYKLVFYSIDETKDSIFLEIAKDAIQIGKNITIIKEET